MSQSESIWECSVPGTISEEKHPELLMPALTMTVSLCALSIFLSMCTLYEDINHMAAGSLTRIFNRKFISRWKITTYFTKE